MSPSVLITGLFLSSFSPAFTLVMLLYFYLQYWVDSYTLYFTYAAPPDFSYDIMHTILIQVSLYFSLTSYPLDMIIFVQSLHRIPGFCGAHPYIRILFVIGEVVIIVLFILHQMVVHLVSVLRSPYNRAHSVFFFDSLRQTHSFSFADYSHRFASFLYNHPLYGIDSVPHSSPPPPSTPPPSTLPSIPPPALIIPRHSHHHSPPISSSSSFSSSYSSSSSPPPPSSSISESSPSNISSLTGYFTLSQFPDSTFLDTNPHRNVKAFSYYSPNPHSLPPRPITRLDECIPLNPSEPSFFDRVSTNWIDCCYPIRSFFCCSIDINYDDLIHDDEKEEEKENERKNEYERLMKAREIREGLKSRTE